MEISGNRPPFDGVNRKAKGSGIFHKMITESRWNESCIWSKYRFKSAARSQNQRFFSRNSWINLFAEAELVTRYDGINFYTPCYIYESCILKSVEQKRPIEVSSKIFSHENYDIFHQPFKKPKTNPDAPWDGNIYLAIFHLVKVK